MLPYEQPQAVLVRFLSQDPFLSGNVNEPALIDDSVSVGETPSFSEGIEDW